MNPHYEEAERLSAEALPIAQWGLTERHINATRAVAEATLALAHEQARAADAAETANLIAFNYVGGKLHSNEVHDQITERLGLA